MATKHEVARDALYWVNDHDHDHDKTKCYYCKTLHSGNNDCKNGPPNVKNETWSLISAALFQNYRHGFINNDNAKKVLQERVWHFPLKNNYPTYQGHGVDNITNVNLETLYPHFGHGMRIHASKNTFVPFLSGGNTVKINEKLADNLKKINQYPFFVCEFKCNDTWHKPPLHVPFYIYNGDIKVAAYINKNVHIFEINVQRNLNDETTLAELVQVLSQLKGHKVHAYANSGIANGNTQSCYNAVTATAKRKAGPKIKNSSGNTNKKPKNESPEKEEITNMLSNFIPESNENNTQKTIYWTSSSTNFQGQNAIKNGDVSEENSNFWNAIKCDDNVLNNMTFIPTESKSPPFSYFDTEVNNSFQNLFKYQYESENAKNDTIEKAINHVFEEFKRIDINNKDKEETKKEKEASNDNKKKKWNTIIADNSTTPFHFQNKPLFGDLQEYSFCAYYNYSLALYDALYNDWENTKKLFSGKKNLQVEKTIKPGIAAIQCVAKCTTLAQYNFDNMTIKRSGGSNRTKLDQQPRAARLWNDWCIHFYNTNYRENTTSEIANKRNEFVKHQAYLYYNLATHSQTGGENRHQNNKSKWPDTLWAPHLSLDENKDWIARQCVQNIQYYARYEPFGVLPTFSNISLFSECVTNLPLVQSNNQPEPGAKSKVPSCQQDTFINILKPKKDDPLTSFSQESEEDISGDRGDSGEMDTSSDDNTQVSSPCFLFTIHGIFRLQL
jgi:hypothetical protein